MPWSRRVLQRTGRRCLRLPPAVIATVLTLAPFDSEARPANSPQLAPSDAATAPGTLVSATPVAGAPDGADAYRILYRSSGLDNEPVTVSGLVVVPKGVAPASGRAVVAWAHPTSGIVTRCAPSEARVRFQLIAGLREFIQRGYLVVATDYPGLGTVGPHPYLVGVSEARAVLDAVRAARAVDRDAGTRFVVWGHSQGGQAALFTGRIAHSYAPEFQLLGVAAAAPATELAALLKADLGSAGGTNLTAMTLWSWSRIYGAPISQVVEAAAMPVVDRLAQECIQSIYDVIVRGRTTKPLLTDFLADPDFAAKQPWSSLLQQNTPGMLPRAVPVFIAQGDANRLVLPEITRDYVQRLCVAGSAVSFNLMPKVGHAWIAAKSASVAADWIDDRFASVPAPSDCRVLAGTSPR